MRKTRRKNASEIIEKSAEVEARKWEYAVPVDRNERPGNERKWSKSDEKGSREAAKKREKIATRCNEQCRISVSPRKEAKNDQKLKMTEKVVPNVVNLLRLPCKTSLREESVKMGKMRIRAKKQRKMRRKQNSGEARIRRNVSKSSEKKCWEIEQKNKCKFNKKVQKIVRICCACRVKRRWVLFRGHPKINEKWRQNDAKWGQSGAKSDAKMDAKWMQKWTARRRRKVSVEPVETYRGPWMKSAKNAIKRVTEGISTTMHIYTREAYAPIWGRWVDPIVTLVADLLASCEGFVLPAGCYQWTR